MRSKILDYFKELSDSLQQSDITHRAFIAIYLFDFLDRLNKEKFPGWSQTILRFEP